MCTLLVPNTTFAQTHQEAREFPEFNDYLVNSDYLADDGYIGIPVNINTYVKGTTNSMTPVAMYIINHAMERIGTEDDVSIISDLLDEGYNVVTLDYFNNPLAVSPDIDWSIQGIKTSINVMPKCLFGIA